MNQPQHNLLDKEASPYLRQHAGNPVHWRGWSAASLAEAQALDRPILLSVGYAACHWCHVMAHESFESQETAALMNRLFVNIKVDREERPDIDQIYMAALSAMGEQGGWPLTMFLTPEGKPFWGGTYFPPEPRYGRPSFGQVLEAIAKSWNEKKDDLTNSAHALSSHVEAQLSSTASKIGLDPDQLPTLAGRIGQMMDPELGGMRGAPKFPNAPFMHSLWLSWIGTGNAGHRDLVLLSLERMLAGGIYDHVGGGLSRYSTDERWLVPHFEKMLYDNAQLLRLCNWALGETANDLFRIRIEETIAWLLREMSSSGDGFTASYDADSQGEEGLFYTWKKEDIDEALGTDSSLFYNYFSLEKPPGWEGDPILFQTSGQQSASIVDAQKAAGLKEGLLAARARRPMPGRDDKVLTDWNGLAIAALAECGRSLGRAQWIERAGKAFLSILESSQEGRLPHSQLDRQALFPALSSDYAAMTSAAVALFEATSDRRFLNHARHFMEMLDRWHSDTDRTGYYLTAYDSADVPLRVRGDVDEAIPSATAQIIEALQKLATATGDIKLQEKAIVVAEHAFGRASRQTYGQVGIVNACAVVIEPMKLILVDDPDNPAFVTVANRHPDPRRVDIVLPLSANGGGATLPDGTHPATDRPAAYLCIGQLCHPPIWDATDLQARLRKR
ncbi:thioredoxin domain protein [Mesorhizobium sp. Root554]|uniref:thioredoxin domain-containing protein n=1 Tax=unclassified Mesorhizobium TaxID=325217 RepID=UPI0006FBC3C7|nr:MULTISPECIES: thioredoxin domain-containing protein [unclassified Mesorhizobium]KQZ15067.1 thioredoxin domain protein [Mesorhizobium sp. Root1471]KQZ37576.1 thioredoxin domain protein [Mesorhizobium sp. Root554]